MNKFPSLNGLRAISITIVILYHILKFNFRVNPSFFYLPIFDGQFGVNVFFVISGFLITSLLIQEENQFNKVSLRKFYTRRSLRIFPAYFFLLLVYLVLQLSGLISIPRTSWLTALTYTKYVNYHSEWYTAHAWSLSIEETFYLFWPFVFVAGKQYRKYTAIFFILAVPIFRVYLFFNPIDWIDNLSLFTRIDAIATGCLISLYRQEILRKVQSNWDLLFWPSLVFIFILPWLAFLANHSTWILIFVALGTLNGTIANVLIGLIMMYSVFGPKGSWFKMLNSKIFTYVGVLSYSLYLWQELFLYKRSLWITHFPQNLFLIFVSAMFSYYIIEMPFLKLKSRFSIEKQHTPPSDTESRGKAILPSTQNVG